MMSEFVAALGKANLFTDQLRTTLRDHGWREAKLEVLTCPHAAWEYGIVSNA